MTNPLAKTVRPGAAVLLAIQLCCAGCQAQETAAGTAADYDQLVAGANSLLKQGKLDQAQQTVRQAIKLEAKRYEAYAVAAKVASQRGATGEASGLVQKALELAPEESKEKVRQLAAMLGQGSTAAPTPAAAVLSSEDRLKLDILMLILEDAQKATASEERGRAFREFLDQSADFAKAHPQQTNLWVMRAFAAVELNDSAAGWPAGKQLKALGMIDSDDLKVRRAMAELGRKGWLSDAPPRQYPKADSPWTNSLGMRFVPMPGTKVLFGVWDVRVKDYEAYAAGVGGVDNSWKSPGFEQGPAHPVVKVSWQDAKAFCRWLTEKEKSARLIGESQSYRLPTDEEWSVAVGLDEPGGGTPRDKQQQIKGVYPWGTQWPPPSGAGNYGSSLKVDDYEYTSTVGSFNANRYGLYDMGGNVWQWCEDWYDTDQKYRVSRGGAWHNFDPVGLLSSARGVAAPGARGNNDGFRVVLADGSSRWAGLD